MNTEVSIHQPDTWIRRIPDLWCLVWAFYCLAAEYQFKWAGYWPDRWNEWPWIKRAMAHTYARLNPADKEMIRCQYEAFLEEDKVLDWQAMAHPVYIADCYLLWGQYHQHQWKSTIDRRVYDGREAKTVCVELKGADRQDALSKFDTNAYEFIRWWR